MVGSSSFQKQRIVQGCVRQRLLRIATPRSINDSHGHRSPHKSTVPQHMPMTDLTTQNFLSHFSFCKYYTHACNTHAIDSTGTLCTIEGTQHLCVSTAFYPKSQEKHKLNGPPLGTSNTKKKQMSLYSCYNTVWCAVTRSFSHGVAPAWHAHRRLFHSISCFKRLGSTKPKKTPHDSNKHLSGCHRTNAF